jgi:signal transduction histidine kinase
MSPHPMPNLSEVELYHSILNLLPSGLIVFAKNEAGFSQGHGALLKINDRALEILQLNPPIPRFTDHLPEYLDPLTAILTQAQEDAARSEVLITLPGQTEPTTLGYALKHLSIQNESYEPIEAKIFIFSDITRVLKDRIEMDKIKEESQQSLKMASIGTMISGVVHELNNPLTGLSMSAELSRLLLKKLSSGLEQLPSESFQHDLYKVSVDALEEVRKTQECCQKMGTLVRDLLNYSKPLQLNLSPYPIEALILECISAIKTHPEFSSMTFQYHSELEEDEAQGAHSQNSQNAGLQVLCEKVKLEQVLYNLFKNASDAVGAVSGGARIIQVVLSQETDTKNLPNPAREYVKINVIDYGCGMTAETVAQIFTPFFSTKKESGLGLGLSISLKTIEQHGGKFTVQSSVGHGTCFGVTLPVYRREGQTVL